MVFNGAQMGRASSVALGGAVHIGCVVPPQTRIPIGWVAVGDPARLYPPGEARPRTRGNPGKADLGQPAFHLVVLVPSGQQSFGR